MSIPAIQITANGAMVPDYADIRAYLVAQYQAIYGADVYLESDSQDGQWIDIVATALHDYATAAADVYNSFSPAFALIDALARNIKINGLSVQPATYSYADVDCAGTVGAVITNGQVQDDAGQVWNLPASVTIGSDGHAIARATSAVIGAVRAPAGTINTILTPTLGWTSVQCENDAVVGRAVETAAEVRARQAVSTALPSQSIDEGISGAILNITGVSACILYDNDTDVTDGNGIPSHSLCAVVEGGDTTAIAQAIFDKRTPGEGTYGDEEVTITDAYGIPKVIKFQRPTAVTVGVEITLTSLGAYSSDIGNDIKAAVAAYISALAIGATTQLTRLYGVAYLAGASGATYEITGIRLKKGSGSYGTSDITMAFDERPACTVSNVEIITA